MKSKLNGHQRFLLEVVEKHKIITSAELFDLYQNSFRETFGEHAYRNQIKYLVQTGLVKEICEGRSRVHEIACV